MKRVGTVLLCMVMCLCGCSRTLPNQTFFALDTVIELRSLEGGTSDTMRSVCQRIEQLETQLSCHKEGGDIWRINHEPYGQMVPVSKETATLLWRSEEISLQTEGCFDVTIKPLADLWNVKEATCPPQEAEIQKAMDQVGFPNLVVDVDAAGAMRWSPDTGVDLGGMAKGWIADEVKRLLQTNGVRRGIVDLGGSITLLGDKADGTPWVVGIKNPFQTNETYAKLAVSDTSVVTSGGYERFFTYEGKNYHHIFDPDTGYPAEAGLRSVTVVSPDTALADALSTAAYVGGKDRALEWAEQFGVEMILVDEEKQVWITEGLQGKLTLLDTTFQLMED